MARIFAFYLFDAVMKAYFGDTTQNRIFLFNKNQHHLPPNHSIQYLTDFFQSNARFHGFAPSFALLGEPETNGVVERFHRTLKEQIIHGRSYQNLAALRAAVATFIHTYNHHWRLEKLRYQSPSEARLAFSSAMPLAA